MIQIIFVGILSHNLGFLTVRASDGPCNACATNASVWRVSAATTTLHCNAVCVTLLMAKINIFAAAPAEWPNETAADQQPLAEHLQHQTGSHSAPTEDLRRKRNMWGADE